MKKALFLLLICILSLSLTACGTDFNGSRTGNDHEFAMEYTVLNKTDSQDLSAEAGDTIHAKLEVEKGSLSVKIQKGADDPVYEGTGIALSDEFEVAIAESGIYTVTVTGDKAAGSIHFTVEDGQ